MIDEWHWPTLLTNLLKHSLPDIYASKTAPKMRPKLSSIATHPDSVKVNDMPLAPPSPKILNLIPLRQNETPKFGKNEVHSIRL